MKRTKIGLILCFLAGLAMVLAGIRGQQELAESGFGSESGYQAIYALSGDVSEAWKSLEAELAELSGAENAAVDGVKVSSPNGAPGLALASLAVEKPENYTYLTADTIPAAFAA